VWAGRGEGGRRREGKEDAKEINQIIQKNKSTMLDEKGCSKVNAGIQNAKAMQKRENVDKQWSYFSQLSIVNIKMRCAFNA
jgi:hypothetical protein